MMKAADGMLFIALLALAAGCSKDTSVTGDDSGGTHTVSGSVLYDSGSGIGDVYVNINGTTTMRGFDERVSYSVPSDASGKYIFTKIGNGTYTITPYKSDFTFNPASRQVMVNGINVSVASFTGIPKPDTGPVGQDEYYIHGRITDSYGDGIGGISVGLAGNDLKMTAETSSRGVFQFNKVPNGSYTIAPGKEGYTFIPPFMTVVVRGGDVTLDTFIASTGTKSESDIGFAGTNLYYPMSRGASWTINRSVADFKNQSIDSYTLTLTVAGTKMIGSDLYWVVVDDSDESEAFIRISNDTVYRFAEISTVYPWNKPEPETPRLRRVSPVRGDTQRARGFTESGRAKTTGALDEPNPYTDPLPYIRFDVEPGTTYDIMTSSRSEYGAGNFTLTWKGTYYGRETVTVTAGTFTDCKKYEILYDAVAVGGGSAQREITTTVFWLAPNVGTVKLEEKKTDGYQTTYTKEEELIGYSVPDTGY